GRVASRMKSGPATPSAVLFDELHCYVFPRAAAIADAEGRITRSVDHRIRFAVDLTVDGAESRVGHLHLAPVLDWERLLAERAARQTTLLHCELIVVGACCAVI